MNIRRFFAAILLSIALYNVMGALVPYNAPAKLAQRRVDFAYDDQLYDAQQTIPAWPYQAMIFNHSSNAQALAKVGFTHESYDANGNVQDSSGYWFKKLPVQIKDLLAISELLNEGKIVTTAESEPSQHFLLYLAQFNLDLKAKTYQQGVSVSYAHGCFDNLFFIGCQIPFVRTYQALRQDAAFDATTSRDLKVKNNGSVAGLFYDFYKDGLRSFFDDVLRQKNFSRNLNDEAIFIGDIKFFVNVPLKSTGYDRGSLSLTLKVPSPQEYNSTKIIRAFTGDKYGAIDLIGALGLHWNISSFLNPHFFSAVTFSPQKMIFHRLPQLFTRVANAADVTLPNMLLSDNLEARLSSAYSVPDANVTDFADGVRAVNLRRGAQIEFQVGNVMQDILIKKLQLDVSYKFLFKATDVLGAFNGDQKYYRESLTNNSAELAHDVSARLWYDYKDLFTIFGSYRFTFAGRRTLKWFEASIGLSATF